MRLKMFICIFHHNIGIQMYLRDQGYLENKVSSDFELSDAVKR